MFVFSWFSIELVITDATETNNKNSQFVYLKLVTHVY